MGSWTMTCIWTVLLLTLLPLPQDVLVAQAPQNTPPVAVERDTRPLRPELADLIPLATALAGHLAMLHITVEDQPDLTKIETRVTEVGAALEASARQLQQLKASTGYQYNRLIALKTAIHHDANALAEGTESLTKAIRKLGAFRKEWLAEKDQWDAWQSSPLNEEPLEAAKQAFTMAQQTSAAALHLLRQQLEPLLALQSRLGLIQARLEALAAEADDLRVTWQNSALVTAVPPMLSFRYVSQFGPELGYGIRRGIDEITWPSKPFFIRQGWVMLLQGVLSLGLILIVFRYRPRLTRSERWQFVAQRPIALGLFAAGLTVAPFYDMSSATFTLAWIALVGIAFVRLMDGLVEAGWKRQVVYGAMLAVLTTRLFFVIGVPLPLFRLYIVMVAGVLVALCLWWAAKSARHGDAPGYAWALYLAAGFYAIVLLVELGGKAALAEWLFDASLRTLVAILAFGLLRYLIRGASEWAVQSSLYQRLTLVRSHETAIVQRLMLLTDILVGVVFLSIVLMFWRVYDSFYEALSGLLALGFTIGTQQVTLALVVTTIGILYGAFLISGILQRLLMDVVLIKRNVETGVKVAIAKLVHYALVFIGFVMALSMLGFKFTQLTIMMSALGVGIGFGLQAIVNNFLCGLILLFERPIRVGDTIELNGQWAQIQKIGLRSTTVRTFDQADVIVPNSDLISNQVTNWTLTDRQVRIIIPVGVAYGSDVPLVMQTLNDCAADNTLIMRMPEPLVFFRNFGESSLDFELRAWVWNVDNMLRVESDLRQEINRRFQEAGIVIAFPQRDVHVYQADNLANSRLWLSMEQPERLASDDTARQSTSRPDL